MGCCPTFVPEMLQPISVAALATKEVKSTGKFVISNICQIKTRTKLAVKANMKMIFGQEVHKHIDLVAVFDSKELANPSRVEYRLKQGMLKCAQLRSHWPHACKRTTYASTV